MSHLLNTKNKKVLRDYGLNRKGGRSLFEILSDFLVYCKSPRFLSDAKQANKLRNDRGKPITEFLIQSNLLSEVNIKMSGRGNYRKTFYMVQTTEKGLKYIESLKVTKSYLGIQ